jgi:hypothetical protein
MEGGTMKKRYPNTAKSFKKCACGKHLKLNLLAKKPNAVDCFNCYYTAEIARRGGIAFTGRTGTRGTA